MAITNCSGYAAGYQSACGRSSSGVKKIHLAPYSASTFSTASVDANNVITQITSGHTHFTFDVPSETCAAEWSYKTDLKNNATWCEGKIELVIPDYNYTLRNQLYAMASIPSTAIVEREDGIIEFWGASTGINATEAKSGVAKEVNGFRGIAVTFEYKGALAPYTITGTTAYTVSY